MGRPITATIPHKLGKEEARRRIAEGFRSAQQNRVGFGVLFSIREHWEGDRLHFEAGGLGQRICGRLDVREETVQIEVDVPELLASLAERLLRMVDARTRKLLE